MAPQDFKRVGDFLEHQPKSFWPKQLLEVASTITKTLNPFPLPGMGAWRLRALSTAPNVHMARHIGIGVVLGIACAIPFRYWHKNVFDARIEDYYTQLAKANTVQWENLRQRLIQEGKEVCIFLLFI
jgi:hypothetical protein